MQRSISYSLFFMLMLSILNTGAWAAQIGTVLNLPLNYLSEQSDKLDPGQPVVTVCNSADRSSMAVGVLERKGFKMPRNLRGGSQAWIDAGLPVYESTKDSPSTPSAQKKEVNLPTKKRARPRVMEEGC